MNQKKAKNGNSQKDDYRYDAFLSYAHKDKPTVVWLHKLLTTYWVLLKRRRRIFMDQENLPADGGLSNQLKAALNESRFLIVCCSKYSSESNWVDLEIKEFLKSHSPDKVLACLVGQKTNEAFVVPASILEVENRLGDELLKPDLRGELQNFHKQALKALSKQAESLLAPLFDLPDKESLSSRRKKNWMVLLLLLVLFVTSLFGWLAWVRSNAYQIRTVVAAAPQYLNFALPDVINDWLFTLVVTTRVEDAFVLAREIKDKEYQYQAFIKLAEMFHKQKNTARAKQAFNEAVASVKRIDTMVSRSMAGVALIQVAVELGEIEPSLNLINDIGQPQDRAVAWAAIADFLFKKNKTVEAVRALDLSLLDWRRSGGPSTHDLPPVFETLVVVGKRDKAVTLLNEVKSLERRCLMQIVVAKALAKAGSNHEAKEILQDALMSADKIEKAESQSYRLLKIAEALSSLGENNRAGEVINKALVVAREGKDLSQRFSTFRQATKLLRKIGNAVAANALLDEAFLLYPKTDPFDYQRGFIALNITTLLIEADRIGEAFKFWCKQAQRDMTPTGFVVLTDAAAKELPVEKMLTDVQTIVTPVRKSLVYAELAKSFAKAGKADDARKALNAAYSVQDLTNENDQSSVLSAIAIAEAKLGRFLKARQNSELCLQSHKLAVYIAILREYHLQHHPEDAKLFEEEPE